jgi:DNA-directed RNA polymerase subunit beta
LVRVYVAQKRKITDGDKLAGRHGNKGVISKILPVEDMPFLEDGTPVDIVLNPLGVPGRMNIGQILELHLGWAPAGVGDRGQPGVGQEPARRGPRCRARHPCRLAGLRRCARGGDHRPARLALPNRDGVRLIDGSTARPACSTVAPASRSRTRCRSATCTSSSCTTSWTTRSTRATGPYSMITQQPLGGKAQFGGQRFGEMEVWALEAYGAAYSLQELLTIKSDDVNGRVKVYEAIVKGENIPEPGIPESFKVLIKEMQSLCLNVEVLASDGQRDRDARDPTTTSSAPPRSSAST